MVVGRNMKMNRRRRDASLLRWANTILTNYCYHSTSMILFPCSEQKNPPTQTILFLIAEQNPLIFVSCIFVLLENAKSRR